MGDRGDRKTQNLGKYERAKAKVEIYREDRKTRKESLI